MYDLFLCYSSKDGEIAHWLMDRLTHLGLTVWWDTEQIESGVKYVERMAKGLAECLGMAALITSSFATAPWATEELWTAGQLYHQMSDRFPAMKRNLLLAVAEPTVYVPEKCCEIFYMVSGAHDADLASDPASLPSTKVE